MRLFLEEWASVLADVPFDAIPGLIGEASMERSRRFLREEDRGRFLAARIGLQRILALHASIAQVPLDLRSGPNGKPVLPEGGMHVNWSHSGAYVAWIVGDHPCGIDVELHDRRLSMDRGSLCTPRELAWLDAQKSSDAAFLDLWTAKESVLKALGHGLSTDPRHVGIEMEHSGELSTWSCQLEASLIGRTCRIESPDAVYSLSWCIIAQDQAQTAVSGPDPDPVDALPAIPTGFMQLP